MKEFFNTIFTISFMISIKMIDYIDAYRQSPTFKHLSLPRIHRTHFSHVKTKKSHILVASQVIQRLNH